MRILMISDTTEGGAAIACRRLYEGLLGEGADVRWVAVEGTPGRGAHMVHQWTHLGSLTLHRALIRLRAGPRVLARSVRFVNECTVLDHIRAQRPDVISLHNIHETMSFSLVERIPARIPVAWTLHDMWPLTGHCTYRMDCPGYARGCSGCPFPAAGGLFGTAARERRRRSAFLRRNSGRFVLVSPSDWLAGEVSANLGPEVRGVCIPNCVDPDVFRPSASVEGARRALGLPVGERVILAGADSLREERKGARFLDEATSLLAARGIPFRVVAFGLPPEGAPRRAGWIYTGYIRDERLLNLYYGAADVFVLPSRAEVFGLVYAEAMAAGTPCVGFDVTACPEVIRNGETGFLARDGDAHALAECIERVLSLNAAERERMRNACRRRVETEYAPRLQAQRYRDLLAELAANHPRR